MTEQQFIEKFEAALGNLSSADRQEVLDDMKEYFASGRADGKTDQEISAGLGDPVEIAGLMKEAYQEQPVQQLVADKGEFVNVQVYSQNARIELLLSPDEEAHVDMKNHTAEDRLQVELRGDTLDVQVIQKRKFSFFQFHSKTPEVTIQLPFRIYQRIAVETNNGAILSSNIEAVEMRLKSQNGRIKADELRTQSFNFQTDNGRIQLHQIQSAKGVAETDNGRIEVSSLQGQTFQAKTDNGRIILKNVRSAIHAETDNGRIEAYIPEILHDVQLTTDNGSIELMVDHEPKHATIRAEKDYGKAVLFGEKSRHLVFGDGSPLVLLKTDNGSIEVKQLHLT